MLSRICRLSRCWIASRECSAFAPQLVIGIGGGSCLDLAKATALLLTCGGQIDAYYGEFKVPGPVLPVIAIPTTAGTGSEVTPVAVIGDSARNTKIGVSSPFLIPGRRDLRPRADIQLSAGVDRVLRRGCADSRDRGIHRGRTTPTPELGAAARVRRKKRPVGPLRPAGDHLDLARSAPQPIATGRDLRRAPT